MSTYCTYDMKGIKSEFADWVSNISPEYTPFISMLRKFPVSNTHFQWQTDSLSGMDVDNAIIEGADAGSFTGIPTTVISGYTQIMRKVVQVSDTANSIASYGREKELYYQLKKAAKELKRDHESIFLLKDQEGVTATSTTPSLSNSFGFMIDPANNLAASAATFEKDIFAATETLYTEGSEADIIMYSPELSLHFSSLQETGERHRIFKNDKRFEVEVNYLVDPLGQEYKLIPNRWLPTGVLYIFRAEDVSMAVLRAPQQTKLAKQGSSEKYMIEQEVGLRLANPLCAAVVTVA